MAGKVVTIAQQKGGAGKTTLCAHLAVALAEMGYQIAVVDTDPQESLAAWMRVRAAFNAGNHALSLRMGAGWRAATEIDKAKREADLVIVDSPPHTEQTAMTAIREADLVVLPIQLSPMDLWATRPTLEMAKKARVAALVVFNRVSPRGKLNDQVLREIAKANYPTALTRLGARTAFAAAMLDGLGVTEAQPKGPAAVEIQQLAGEIVEKLGLA